MSPRSSRRSRYFARSFEGGCRYFGKVDWRVCANRVVSEISQQVRLLDGLVRYRFGDNAERMGAWASARNVEGPFRSHAEPAAGGVTPAVVKPAA